MNKPYDRLEKLEKVVEKLSQNLENLGRKIGDGVENNIGRVSNRKSGYRCNNQFWGWALLGMGLLLLNHSMEWFALDFPMWAIICIGAGAYLIIKSRRRE